ncbi:hypothetical protein GIB67_002317 [Kingdonia uniflora]|uniref:Plastocyanin-like domain-containing protein n=1 Tax=Kingdonia uniflora TaxID=39325 RepID=A0A7J7KX36_9MAGN|nr:hypothetical protein GIB67_002317 [Kingdonia uniflora]
MFSLFFSYDFSIFGTRLGINFAKPLYSSKLIIHILNYSSYNLTIHCHSLIQNAFEITGEWINRNVVNMETEAQAVGVTPDKSVVFTINGRAGDLYPCSNKPKGKL